MEENKMKHAATLKDCDQYSPDDFQGVTRVKEIKPETTIQELIEWQKKLFPHNKKLHDEGELLPIQIIKME